MKKPILFIIFLTFAPVANAQVSNDRLLVLGQEAVKERLKDPESAKFGKSRVVGNVVCGSVNSKNSMGGFTGQKRFISAGMSDVTFFEMDMAQDDFDYVWSVKCGG